jgi:hypothetical protein
MIDTTIIIISIFVFLFILKKFNVLKQIDTGENTGEMIMTMFEELKEESEG